MALIGGRPVAHRFRAWTFALLLGVPAVHAQDFSILYHETLPALDIVETATVVDGAAGGGPRASLSFVAFGRQFDLRLERNDTLARRLRASGRAPDIAIYRGELVGVPGSWARLTRQGKSLSGAVWDGSNLYGIETAGTVGPRLVGARGNDPSAHVIFRARDTVGVLFDAPSQAPRDALSRPMSAAAASATAPQTLTTPPLKQLDIGLIADEKFTQTFAQSEAALLSIANVLEGIFFEQLGIHLNVAELEVFHSGDPFSATLDADTLLDEVETHKGGTATLRPLGLAHLFTGRDLIDPGSSGAQLVGVAYLGAVCHPTRGAGLSQATFGASTAALIAAHEIGHNLGAPHDGQPGPCASTPFGFLMAPQIGSQTFSACSIVEMRKVVDSAPCLLPPPPNDLALRTFFAPASVVQSLSSRIELILNSAAGTDALLVELTAQGSSGVTVGISGSNAGWTCNGDTCRASHAPPGQYAFDVRLVAQDLTQPAVVTVTASAANDPNPANNTVSVSLPVAPSVEVSVSIDPPTDVVLRPGDEVVWRVKVRNDKNTATNVTAELALPDPVAIQEIVGATCTLISFPIDARCSFGAVPAGATRQLEVRARVNPLGSDGLADRFLVTAKADEHNLASGFAATNLLVVNALADLKGTINASASAQAGAAAQYTVTYENQGPDAAQGLTFTINTFDNDIGMDVSRFTSNIGACEPRPSRMFHCTLAKLAAGEKFVLTLDGAAGAAGTYTLVTAVAVQSAFDPTGGDAAGTLFVAQAAPAPIPPATPAPTPPSNPPVSSGGGGGGAIDPTWLLLLVAAAARRGVGSASRRRSAGVFSV